MGGISSLLILKRLMFLIQLIELGLLVSVEISICAEAVQLRIIRWFQQKTAHQDLHLHQTQAAQSILGTLTQE